MTTGIKEKRKESQRSGTFSSEKNRFTIRVGVHPKATGAETASEMQAFWTPNLGQGKQDMADDIWEQKKGGKKSRTR